MSIAPELLDRFSAIVGTKNALRDDNSLDAYLMEGRGRYRTQSPMVLRPESVDQVSSILKLATETKTAIVPQGGNTGLVGAGVPIEGSNDSILLSLGRMNQILKVDPATNTMLAESGAILQTLQEAADGVDRLFPLTLGSQGSCQIGGNIGSNAGGTGVLAYGNTRDLVMGLEVVLPTGEVLNGLSRLRKDNTGYDLKNLFIGAEGTLGVVTKAVLKLFPRPKGQVAAFVGLTSPAKALSLFHLAKSVAGNSLTAFELMSKRSMDFTVKHANVRRPLEGNFPWFALLEISSGESEAHAISSLEALLGKALENEQIEDAVLSQSEGQRQAFWQLREDMSPAQKPEGASIKNDISVPIGVIPEFIEQADAAVLKICPDARIVNFGHMGDGNLHYNISQPAGWTPEQFFALEDAMHDAINDLVVRFDGSISAEHGIGTLKREKLSKVKDPVALALMKRLKREFDPANIMNPGKVI